jgi:hypothetical protein
VEFFSILLMEPVRIGSTTVDAIPFMGASGDPLAARLYFRFAKHMAEREGWDDVPPR